MKKVNEVGIDVSAKKLDVLMENEQKAASGQFDNTSAGWKKLVKMVTASRRHAKVVLEATGNYSLGVALALDDNPRTEVMVANPRAMKRFGEAMLQRSKTDSLDARTILKFCQRMDFVPWTRPSEECLELRGITRRMRQLQQDITAEKNRLHSKGYAQDGTVVANDIEVNVRHLERRFELIEKKAAELIEGVPKFQRKLDLLLSIKGIGVTSGLQILAELLMLPEEMKAPQWVAYAGLDPKEKQSGTSVKGPKRISKAGCSYLRAALYLPAMSASNTEPHVRSFYLKLVEERGKKRILAQVAVMRKLLHAIWGMFRKDELFDGEKFHPLKISQ